MSRELVRFLKRTALGVAALLAFAAVAACSSTESADPADQPAASAPAEQGETAPAKEQPKETAGQQNARESAESYLATGAFSRKGLIEQLKFEGYSKKDAAYAVEAISPELERAGDQGRGELPRCVQLLPLGPD